jgi:predicted metalloprotease with PDZ domain
VSVLPFVISLSVSVFAQGYGYDAGLRVGDRLVTVDGVDASKMNVEQVQLQRCLSLSHSLSAETSQLFKIEEDSKKLKKGIYFVI